MTCISYCNEIYDKELLYMYNIGPDGPELTWHFGK